MKNKLILALISLTLTSSAVFSLTLAQDFLIKFSSCTKSFTDDGKKITAILGWTNRKCQYKEMSARSTVTCSFTNQELKEIVNELKSKNTTGIADLQSGKKYMQKEEICKIEKSRFFPDDSEEEY